MSSNGCWKRLELLNETGITSDVTGSFISIPIFMSRYYLQIDATEVVAGAMVYGVQGNDEDSETDSNTLAGGAVTVTGIIRKVDNDFTVALGKLLPPWIYFTLSSISGTWDVSAALYYSTSTSV